MSKSSFIMCLWISLFTFQAVAAKQIGKVISVKGEVYIAHLFKKKQQAKVGDLIFEKDKIKTKEGQIVIDNGTSEIELGPNSYLKIPKGTKGKKSNTKLALYGGGLRFKVNKLSAKQSFTVKTPSAVAGVRGTEGRVDYSDGVTACESIPHAEGGDKSIIWTAPPSGEYSMNQAIQDSRENEVAGKNMGNESPKGVVVVNEGQASVTLPDGSAILVEVQPGQSLSKAVRQVVASIKKGASAKAIQGSLAQRISEASENEERFLQIIDSVYREVEQARTELPGAPSLPNSEN